MHPGQRRLRIRPRPPDPPRLHPGARKLISSKREFPVGAQHAARTVSQSLLSCHCEHSGNSLWVRLKRQRRDSDVTVARTPAPFIKSLLATHSMLPFKLVFHPRYDLNLGAHVFPSQKFRLIYEMLLHQKLARQNDFLRPEPASDEDILRVHTADWVRKLKTGTLTASDVMRLEVPYSPELAEAVWLAAGGSILAGQMALCDGFSSNLSGGFRHAYPEHGEGFCAIHDVAVAIRRLQADGAIKKAIVVDTDVHHGNGTAAIFRTDPSVFTISIHQLNNYPGHKPPSSIDLNMPDRVDDDEYLNALIPAVQKAMDE